MIMVCLRDILNAGSVGLGVAYELPGVTLIISFTGNCQKFNEVTRRHLLRKLLSTSSCSPWLKSASVEKKLNTLCPLQKIGNYTLNTPIMAVKKSTFFVALFVILILPFLLHNFFWIVMSREINGSMRYVGKSTSGQLSKEFSVIRFFIEKDTVWFNGMDNYFFKKDEVVPVRYQVNEPVDARINSFVGLWGDTIMYITPLLLINGNMLLSSGPVSIRI